MKRNLVKFKDFKDSHENIEAQKGKYGKAHGLRTPAKAGAAGYKTADKPSHVGGKIKNADDVRFNKNQFGVKPPKKRLSAVKVHENANMVDSALWDALTRLVADAGKTSGDESKVAYTLKAFAEEFALNPAEYSGAPMDESHAVVFDGTSYYVIPSEDLESEIESNGVELFDTFEDFEKASKICDRKNAEL